MARRRRALWGAFDGETPSRGASSAGVASPCTGVCVLDDTQLCRGCHRLMDEIICWTACDEQQRAEIVARAAARRRAGR